MPAEITSVVRRAHPADDLAGRDPGVHDHARRRQRARDPGRGRRPGRLPGDGRGDGRRSSWSASLSAYVGTRHAPVAAPQPGAGSLRDQLRIVAAARDFRWLLVTFVIQALATGCMLAGVDYLASDVLGKDGAATILFVCFVGPALLLTPVWAALGTRIGKKRGYVIASLFLATGALLAATAQVAPPAVVYLAVALVGVGYAGCQVFPMAMLPDAAAVDARRTGSNRAGVYTGVWTAGETLGLALGPGVFALVLAIGGYQSSTDGDIAQPDSALTAITLGLLGRCPRC